MRCTTYSTGVTSLGCAASSKRRGMGREDPLAHGHVRIDVVHQVRRRLRHAPGSACGAKPAPLAAKRHQLVVAAVAAVQAQEAVGQDAAFQESVELVLHELRQVGTGSVFGLGEEGRSVLLHQAVQRGLLRAVALGSGGGWSLMRSAATRPG